MSIVVNQTAGVAIDQEYFYQPMATCPRGVKVLLLNPGGSAVLGRFKGEPFWLGWSPLPKVRKPT